VFVELVLYDQNGPVIGEEIVFAYQIQENEEDRLVANTDQNGSASLELLLSDDIEDTLLGSVFVREMVIPVRIHLSQGRDVFAQDLDGDGLPDFDEILRGTDRLNPDTDGDGLSDMMKLIAGGLIRGSATGELSTWLNLSYYPCCRILKSRPSFFRSREKKSLNLSGHAKMTSRTMDFSKAMLVLVRIIVKIRPFLLEQLSSMTLSL
jgi:hypothetical protein